MYAVRDWLVSPDNPRSFSARARARRWDTFLQHFPELDAMSVLDLGGTPEYWQGAPVRPEHVTTVNLQPAVPAGPWMSTVRADACAAPGRGYDLVVSNSLLEHLGGPYRRQVFAEVVHSAAPHHWVQTPYRYFPLEPHWLFPGFQWLPLAAKVAVTRRWKHGHRHALTEQRALDLVLEVDLVSVTEMAHLFPSSLLWRERAAGLTKSLVAIA